MRLRLDFAGGRYTAAKKPKGSYTDIPEVKIAGAGGIALAPDGSLRLSPAGQPRVAAGVGLMLEPEAENLLSIRNAAPLNTSGWALLNTRPAGATITRVDDREALEAAGVFGELLAASVMNGFVIRLFNPAGRGGDFAVPLFGVEGRALAISSYVRCVSGTGFISVTGGGGSGAVFAGPAWQRVGRIHTAGAQARFLVQPGSEVLVILPQVEAGRITSPIVTAGAPVKRAADTLTIAGGHLVARPHTALIEIDFARQDNVERTLLSLSNVHGETMTLARTTDNALSGTQTGSYRRPRLPRIYGPGRLRAAHRVGTRGQTIGTGGLLAHAPFLEPPRQLDRMTIGMRVDGSAPLNGWVRSIEIIPEVADEDLEKFVAPPVGAIAFDLVRYISPTGNDAADGATPATAWRTLAKVSDPMNMWPGQHVMLQPGGVWAETLRPTALCTYRPYGAGTAPQVGVDQTHGVDENGANDWRIQGLHITRAKSRAMNAYGGSGIMVSGCEASYCGSVTDNNAGGFMVRAATRQATARLLSSPDGSTLPAYRTTEAGLSGNFTIECSVAGAGSASRWRVRRPDGSLIGTATGGTEFNGGGIIFTVASTAATTVGDQFVVRNLPFREIPFPTNGLAEDFLIEHCHVHNIVGLAAGDDVYCEGIGGTVIVRGNRLDIPVGLAADCVQVSRTTALHVANPAHVIIDGNHLSMDGASTSSGKGCVVVIAGSALIQNNWLYGLNFGIGHQCEGRTIIRWNRIQHARYQPYSWAIGTGGDIDIGPVEIYENVILDCNRAISFSGTGATTMTLDGRIARLQHRADCIVRDNVISDCGVGIFIDRPTSGRMQFNSATGVTTMIDRRTAVIPPGVATELRIGFNTTA